jgi:predicted DNA-binding transcriptional regulator AlpA
MNGPTELLTVADICRKLGVSRAWVIEHSNGRRRPVLPSIKLGKVRRFDPTELEGFIDDCRRIGQARVRSASGRVQA